MKIQKFQMSKYHTPIQITVTEPVCAFVSIEDNPMQKFFELTRMGTWSIFLTPYNELVTDHDYLHEVYPED